MSRKKLFRKVSKDLMDASREELQQALDSVVLSTDSRLSKEEEFFRNYLKESGLPSELTNYDENGYVLNSIEEAIKAGGCYSLFAYIKRIDPENIPAQEAAKGLEELKSARWCRAKGKDPTDHLLLSAAHSRIVALAPYQQKIESRWGSDSALSEARKKPKYKTESQRKDIDSLYEEARETLGDSATKTAVYREMEKCIQEYEENGTPWEHKLKTETQFRQYFSRQKKN